MILSILLLGARRVLPVVAVVVALLLPTAVPAFAGHLTPKERLGQAIFFDSSLSAPAGQACAACHAPQVGWTGPDQSINKAGAVYEGAVPGRFGNRKPPAAAYAGDSPVLHYDEAAGTWIGGMFWDGRATGETLGDPLAEQALGPFLNPLEQNNASPAVVVDKVKVSPYADLFEAVWGQDVWSDVSTAYDDIGRSVAAYERSFKVSAFTSKYDAFLAGRAKLTGKERLGMRLFMGKAKCSGCHVPPLFTDYSYDNLGIPRNPLNLFYAETDFNPLGTGWIDYGLGGYLEAAGFAEDVYAPQFGKFKVPTLRNVDQRPYPGFVKAYGHNGFFKSLAEIVRFYNTRDIDDWPPPEVAQNVNTTELGDLHLNRNQEEAIVAFLGTLTDGYLPGPVCCH
jgi:cytochrome c peroxidase